MIGSTASRPGLVSEIGFEVSSCTLLALAEAQAARLTPGPRVAILTLSGHFLGGVMDCLYFPVIDQGDYNSFRSIMHDELPATYDEWLQRHADRVAYYRETRKIIEVKVKANDFAAYLRTRSHGANMNSLYAFTELVGKRNKN